ncbi:Yip1 family protein [Paenibacillus aurantius]|uniref:Yip1 family protein n=1 Tax=Paenibacillus aurantius TaxID=2918900 RepID=A0AA96L9I3_9BACL|nr:Yip1 family protein [Paenibacillus aurantius]WNQ08989.1 Yip1 family protein [Paenibacillus aurantius]
MKPLNIPPESTARLREKDRPSRQRELSSMGKDYLGAVGFQLKQAFRILKHPFDVFWDIRYRNRASLTASVVLLVLAYIVLLVSESLTAYTFNPTEAGVNPLQLLVQYGLPWLTWVMANYMIASIMKGQGRWTEVFTASSYSLMPFILLSVPAALITNVLTLSEKVVYSTAQWVMIGWTLILFFIMVKEIHNYDIQETIVNLVVTVLFMIAVWVLLFIVAGLTFQLYDFLTQVIREVTYRA